MPKVIGFHRSSFSFDDGRSASGFTMYLSTPIRAGEGSGVMTERVFLSDAKLNGYAPKLDDNIIVDRSSSGSARGVYLLK